MNENTALRKQAEPTRIFSGLTSYWTDRTHSYSAQNVAEMNDWRRKAWRELILRHAPAGQSLRVLDVGTGPGFFAMNLALAGHEVTAVDATDHMIFHAKRNAEDYGAKVDFIVNRGEFLPFEDEQFDLVVSRNVTWNLEYPDNALAEWKRVLVPGGQMVYFDANWYLYLFDEELKARRDAVRKAFRKKHPDFTGGGDLSAERVRDLETLAWSLPLSRERRPEWDRSVLSSLGMHIVEIIGDIKMNVTDPSMWDMDNATPMFMVCAEKGRDTVE